MWRRGSIAILAAACAVLALAGCDKDEQASPPPRAEVSPADPAGPRAPGAAPASGREPADDRRPPFTTHADAADALAHILARGTPRVLGFGEYHQKTSSAAVRSALARFTEQMLPVIAARTSDVVIETWVREPGCAPAREVGEQIQKDTERPEVTESELSRLVAAVRAAGIEPHVMTMRCDDFEALRAGGEVDYARLLALVTRELGRIARSAVRHRDREGDAARDLVVVYGGSLHNDLYPYEVNRANSYAAPLAAELEGGFVEIDLYVPEYVAGDALLRTEPWFPLLAERDGDQVLVIERGPRSYIVLLRPDQKSVSKLRR